MKAVVPIRGLSDAKQRLATVLSASERRALMICMVDDVLAAVGAAKRLSGVWVVTGDEDVQQLLHGRGVEILDEPNVDHRVANAGLNAAYSMAARLASDRGETGILLLPADIPLITGDAIDKILSCHGKRGTAVGDAHPSVTVVPAGADGGTNALALSPPQIMATGFGHNSCQRHCALAKAANIEPLVVNLPAVALDIDTLDDVQELLAMPVQSRTQQYLLDSGLATKLKAIGMAQDGRQVG